MPPHLEDHALPAYVYQPEVPRSHDFHRVRDLSVGLLANGPSFRRPVSVLFSGLLLLLVALVDQELNVVLMDLRLLDGVKCIFPSLITHKLPERSSAGLELAPPVVLKVVNHQSLQMVLTPCSSLPELELFTSFASITSVEEVGDLPVCLLLLVVSSQVQLVLLVVFIFCELANDLVQLCNLIDNVILVVKEIELQLQVAIFAPPLHRPLLLEVVEPGQNLSPASLNYFHVVYVYAPGVVELLPFFAAVNLDQVVGRLLVSGVLLTLSKELKIPVESLPH